MKNTMKNLSVVTLWLLLAAAAYSQSNSFTVSGSTDNGSMSGKKVFLTIYHNDGQSTSDSTVITPEGTFSFAGSVKSPCVAYLNMNYDGESPVTRFHFFLENSTIDIRLKTVESRVVPYSKPVITGSRSDSIYRADCQVIIDEHFGTETWESPALLYLQSHSNSIYAPYIYYMVLFNHADYKSFSRQMDNFGGEAKNTYHYKLMKSKSAMKKHIAIGAKIPAFALPDTAGNKVNVFDFAKGKKYVLVTFWASWCGPCREEFRHLKELYAEYKDKGFDIIAVSVDDNRAKWVKAVSDDALPWTNVCELDFSAKSVARSIFGISSVPYGFLIDGKGKIVHHGSNIDSVIKFYMNK